MDQLGIIVRPAGWGARKGGLEKFARYGCNLTLEDRMRGGRIVGMSNSVRHLSLIGSVGGVNSMKSGRNPWRKVRGPFGTMMYNALEKQSFLAMVRAGMAVEYEPVVLLGSRRIVPDFRVGRIYVECTGDPKVSPKAERFLERFQLLRKHKGAVGNIVVTLPNLVERYKLYLGKRALVTTVDRLVDTVVAASSNMVGPAGFEPATPRSLKETYQSCALWRCDGLTA
jgi:hypothetical protein